MKEELTPTSTVFGGFFWITHFMCITIIFLFNDLITKIFMFFIMTLITLHFWARSDYRNGGKNKMTPSQSKST